MHISLAIGAAVFLVLSLSAVDASSPAIPGAMAQTSVSLPSSNLRTISRPIDTSPFASLAAFPEGFEILLIVPPLDARQLPNGCTMVYSVLDSADPDAHSMETRIAEAFVQTGAYGTGAPSAQVKMRMPPKGLRYMAIAVMPSKAGVGDASEATATLALRV